MPYPDSEYPSILRGKDKRESQRLLAAAPALLSACKLAMEAGEQQYVQFILRDAIDKAEGRE
jgi:hypothetical protein